MSNNVCASANQLLQSKSWRDVLQIHPAAELFPLMSPDELRELARDIRRHGLREPVSIVESKNGKCVLIDGRNRLDALELLGDEERFNLDNSIVFEKFLNDIDVHARVVSLNLHRRHLTAEQKRELIGKLIKTQPEKSDLQIAKTAKVGHPTVARVRKKLEAKGDVERRSTRTDTKGRKQPAKKATTAKNPQAPRAAHQRRAAQQETKARDDISATSTSELARLQARVDELENEKRWLEIETLALRSKVEELKVELAERAPSAEPPASDGLDIPDFLDRTREATP